MKALGPLLSWLSKPVARRNAKFVIRLVVLLILLVTIYSVTFHYIMASEGRDFSWITGIYWTITVMSTLGLGDITFESDAGRAFSIVVMLSGALFILVLLPFAFIQFVFMPWMTAREAARAPRKLPELTSGHIVLTQLGAVTGAVIERARDADVPYVLVVPELSDALDLNDRGYRVMVGALDDPDTYRAARVERAALVVTTQPDTTNTNVVFTVREITGTVPVIATASKHASVDILDLAGSDMVLQMGDLLGAALARRVLGGDRRAHVVGEFDSLLVAEAGVGGGELVGRTLADTNLRSRCGVTVAGIWERGRFELPGPDAVIDATDVLILTGSDDQLAAYDRCFGVEQDITEPVVVIGGGRVGRATAARLADVGADCKIIETQSERVRDPDLYVVGDAAELSVLKEAGIDDACAVIITTHDDDVNVYLTIYIRRLRPDIQIIARSNLDRNVATLNRAGADAVLSYASIGAAAIWNTMGRNDSLVLAEGLEMFRQETPPSLVGRSLRHAAVRKRTGCNVVGIVEGDTTATNPDPDAKIPASSELLVIGDTDARRRFFDEFPAQHHRH